MIKTINDKEYFKRDDVWWGFDKNNKEYKVYQKPLLTKLNELNGLGDVVSKVTKLFKIKECEECKKRKETLNSIFPFTRNKVIRDLTEEELEYMTNIKDGQSSQPLFKLYNDLFNNKLEVCACPGLQRTMVDRINLVISIQKDEK